jgi:hypothetical protein
MFIQEVRKLGIEVGEKREKEKKRRIDCQRFTIDVSHSKTRLHRDKFNNTKKDQHLKNLKINRQRSIIDMPRRLWWVGQSKQYENLVNVLAYIIHTSSNFPFSFSF